VILENSLLLDNEISIIFGGKNRLESFHSGFAGVGEENSITMGYGMHLP